MLTDCVPSKTLIATAELMTDVAGARRARACSFQDHEGDAATTVVVDLGRVNARVKQLAPTSPPTSAAGSTREGVAVVAGRGRLDGAGPGRGRRWPTAASETLEADAVLVATGAAPRTLPDARARRRADPDLGAGLRPRPSCPSS